MDNIDFNKLEFNLYELLNLNQSASIDDVKKIFRKIVKKFHPDKISELEEKIYYNITLANLILSNEKTKNKYDNWLNNKDKDFNFLKSNFKNDNVKEYFPTTKQEALVGFHRDAEILLKRHGNYIEDNKSFSTKLEEVNVNRNNLKDIKKNNFRNTEDFNITFDKKKVNGDYSHQITKYDNEEIIPYNTNKNNINYVELKNFNKLYLEDNVQTSSYTSLNRAFLLQPLMNNTKEDINKELSKYNNQTEELKTIDINI
uniref:J domain-containing protein n=1 Tax=viral metagenome TaxID=1070528 RepID=A0A6C0J346_9ZZZZ